MDSVDDYSSSKPAEEPSQAQEDVQDEDPVQVSCGKFFNAAERI